MAWQSLDEQDRHRTRFPAHLLSALQTIDPSDDAGLPGTLDSPQTQPFDSTPALLPAELATLRGPFGLVLDDSCVCLDPKAHALLRCRMVSQPLGMRLVLSGRSDPPSPVGRRRAAGALTELRVADLQFTLDECRSRWPIVAC